MNTYKAYCRANTIARLFYCYLLLLHIFVFRLCRCSTVKIGSKRDKLSLKTYRLPRVGLNKKFGSFFIYATIYPFSLTSGFATLTTPIHLLFPVLSSRRFYPEVLFHNRHRCRFAHRSAIHKRIYSQSLLQSHCEEI